MPELTANTFAEDFGINVSDIPADCLDDIANADFNYDVLEGEERDATVLEVVKALASGDLKRTGNIDKWEKGWGENLDAYIESNGDPEALTPRYFRDGKMRYRQDFIQAVDDGARFEIEYYKAVRKIIFSRYMADVDSVVEFGSGPGTSLLMLSQMYPDKPLIGCDWATSSQEIIKAISERTGKRMTGVRFDMFQPNNDVSYTDQSAIVSLAAMEQLGDNWQPFFDYLMSTGAKRIIHLEPIVELYDADNLVDFLAIEYHKKRGYLQGFYARLQDLEAQGKVEISEARRLKFGSQYHEAYTLLVWRPI